MTPDDFVIQLDEWAAKGGEAVKFPDGQRISTAREAEAVCRALRSPHSLEVVAPEGSRLEQIASLFLAPETAEAVATLRANGLPILREILQPALEPAAASNADLEAAHLMVVKVLAAYQEPVDANLIVKAVRKPLLPEKLLWWSIFSVIQREHPSAVEICEALADPLPPGFLGVMCLELANVLAISGRLHHHPFDNAAGLAKLTAYLEPNDRGDLGEAIAAAVSIPFLAPAAGDVLLAKAAQHPDWRVRIEAAWAAAKRGSEDGRAQLAAFCTDPRHVTTAVTYLEELGLQDRIPAASREADFLALAEMSDWLAYPTELGRVPDEIEIYDRRELFWPPTSDTRTVYLVLYRCNATANHHTQEGIGMVGSTTFVLSGETSKGMPPEDIYALHCAYELAWQEDPRAPEDRTVAAGRKLLAEHNPGL